MRLLLDGTDGDGIALCSNGGRRGKIAFGTAVALE
jgi:hypothetical protein